MREEEAGEEEEEDAAEVATPSFLFTLYPTSIRRLLRPVRLQRVL